ncbi:sensor histidine kinase [Nocardioides alcanivorans]|uniref:sensor histidine kinase n=1 Tax=Nocardioides alcanivorans TaxID=2897352 RepID=UPI001F4261DC|nr:PAS domain-containing sensor histidine kinase [Nocardioides alcanivorans]
MANLDDIVESRTDLDADDVDWLHRLTADWQIIADLAFADLVLWLPDRDRSGFWAAGQMRPTTGPTALHDDVVGTFVAWNEDHMLRRAYEHGRSVREGDPEWRSDIPVRVETIPVRRGERVIAVVARNTNLLGVRTPSQLELAYLEAASELNRMIERGGFPSTAARSAHADTPRVGDGFVRIDAAGQVSYASPNAQSVYRKLGHTGDLSGHVLADLTRQLVPPKLRPDEETLSAVLGGRAHLDTEIDADGVSLIARSIPLRPTGDYSGALVLLRDVTDLRRRDRELVTKDATIREIHHRVKNNLQTVAALLRLQARRMNNPDARSALEEAVRRVGSIAIVHETLSQAVEENVDFDEIVERLGHMVTDVSTVGEQVRVERVGNVGVLPSETATALAMVITEVLQNAVEHGYVDGDSGRIRLVADRLVGRLHLVLEDDGCGLPDGFDLDSSTSLGLSIVRTLVESELGGLLTIEPAHPPLEHGTRVSLDLPVN